MANFGGMGEHHVPLGQTQHWLFRSGRNEGGRFRSCQPPILSLAPRVSANVAVVSLGKRHMCASLRSASASPRNKGRLTGEGLMDYPRKKGNPLSSPHCL